MACLTGQVPVSKMQVIHTHMNLYISYVNEEISQGCIITISFAHNGEAYIVVNVYGQNEDRENIYAWIYNWKEVIGVFWLETFWTIN